jgi:hypothetical protein
MPQCTEPQIIVKILPMPHINKHVTAMWAVVVMVFLAKLALILSSTTRELASTIWISDDAIIEMAVARNIANGLGFSLDGINPTTGAPFLWIYLSSLNHMFFGLDGAFKFTLIENGIFGSLATVLTFFTARKISGSNAVAWIAFLLSTFTANAFFNAINGMETSMFTLFVVGAVATFFDVGRPLRWSPFAWGCVTGAFLGLTMLTRGDGIFITATLGLVQMFAIWKSAGKERQAHLQPLIGMVVVAGLCFGGFMLWQLFQTGSPFPDNQVGRRGMSMSLHNFTFEEFSLSRYLAIVGWNAFQLETLIRIAIGSSVLGLVALGSALLQPAYRRFAVVTGIYSFIFFTLLITYQWYFPDFHGLRYLNAAAHLFFVLMAIFLWQLPNSPWKKTVVGVLTASIILIAGYRHYDLGAHMPWGKYLSYISRPSAEDQQTFWGLIDWMDENLPEGTVVGVRDYGRVTLFTDLAIQDISGNIYPQAIVTLNNGTLDEYLKSRGINYLLIPSLEMRQDKLYRYLHNEMTLERVPGAPDSPTQLLYKIVWDN